MNRIMFIVILSMGFTAAIGQCDKSATCKAVKGRFIQKDATQNDLPINATITIDKSKIVLIVKVGGQSMSITNTIKIIESCEWIDYLKSGSAIYKVSTDKGDGGILEDSIIKITGKEGKTTIYFASDPDERGGIEMELSEIKIENL